MSSARPVSSPTHTGRVGASWFALFSLAWLALWTVQLTPLQLLIPLQLNTPGDADRWIAGVVQSGLVLGIGGLAAIVVGPLAGALSDRTRSRLGRRRPWALGGTAVTVASLLGMAFARGPLAVGAAWVGVMVGFATASSAFTALIADQLTDQRGSASAAVGSAQAVGIVLGVGVVVVSGVGLLGGYLLLAGLMAVAGVVAALLLPDALPVRTGAAQAPTPAISLRSDVLGDANFVRMLIGRLTGNIGNALGTGLLLFFLMFGIGQPAAAAENNLLLLIVVYTVFVVAASVIGGLVSDRTGRRKGMVVGSALVQAAAAAIIAVSPMLPVTVVAAALIGIGYGVFNAGGLALATDLLPGDDANAQDLGIVNVSANLGQLLGPVIGAGLIALLGGFWLLFAAAAVFSLVGAALTATVRAR